MSKKLGLVLLVSTTLLFAGFILGLIVGKNITVTQVSVSQAKTDSLTVPDKETTVIETEYVGLININTASVDELMELPGIGKVIAQQIVDYREQHGNFSSVDDLINVNGIGQKRILSISEYITVGG